jgi:ABC-type antimicrobial peptide transport system permease subunit
MKLSAFGVVIGTLIAAGLSALLARSLLLRDAFNLGGYTAGIALVLAACLVAAYVPSRRAARANPVEALRADS